MTLWQIECYGGDQSHEVVDNYIQLLSLSHFGTILWDTYNKSRVSSSGVSLGSCRCRKRPGPVVGVRNVGVSQFQERYVCIAAVSLYNNILELINNIIYYIH